MKYKLKVLDLGCSCYPKPDATHKVDITGGNGIMPIDLNKWPYPFKDRYFDKIYADNIFEHLGLKLFSFITECHRMLKPDGILVLKMPNAYFILKRLSFLFRKKLPSYFPQHLQYPRPSYVKETLEFIGFEAKGNPSDSLAREINFTGRRRE